MVNKGANIDLLFRNGLKDFEVLPPVAVWNNIRPVIRKKQRPFILLRTAALIAVLLSMSFLAYKWSREISTGFENPVIALGEESVQPQNIANISRTSLKAKDRNTQSGIIQKDLVTDQTDIAVLTDNESINEQDLNYIPKASGPSLNSRFNLPRQSMDLLNLNYKTDNVLYIADLEKQNYLSDPAKEKINRWSVTAMASPTYYPTSQSGSDDIAKQIMSSEQSQISYSGGVALAYNISKKLSIQSGLYYSSIGQEVDGINSFGGFRQYVYTKGDHNFEVLTSNGKIFTNNSDVFLLDGAGERVLTRYTNDVFDPAKSNLQILNSSLHQNFGYLEMPVILRYKLIDRSIDLNLIGGLSYNLLINNSVYTMVDGDRYTVGTTGLNPFIVSSSLGMGMEYSLSEKFSLNFEPTFRYYLNPFGKMPELRTHPYSFGIFSGLSYKF
jgi:hypothetical protein